MSDSTANAIMWVAVSAGVIAGLYFTKSAWCLWAFILPIGNTIRTKK